jgi:phage conserved hypothetical protein, C-terminal domain
MNYIAEINAFEQWLRTNYLSPLAQLIWYKLLALDNSTGWKEWFTVSNGVLLASTSISSEKTLIKNRDALIEAGLIEYQKGKKGTPNKYKINTVNNTVQTTVEKGVKREVYKGVQTAVEKGVIPKQNNSLKKDTNVSKKDSHAPLIQSVVDYLNLKTESNYQSKTKKTRDLIIARINEGYSLDDFKKVVDIKTQEWKNDTKFAQYLRPETLFGNKFESYLNQKLASGKARPNNPQNFTGRQYDATNLEMGIYGK